MQHIAALISSLAQVGWLVIVVFLLWRFRSPLSNVVERLSKFRLRLSDGTKVEVSASEVVGMAQQLLDEVDERLIKEISESEQKLLRYLVQLDSEPTVGEAVERVFGEKFVRPSPELEVLRKLRDRQLIRPREGGRFREYKHLQIKPFGSILLRIRRDALLGKVEPA